MFAREERRPSPAKRRSFLAVAFVLVVLLSPFAMFSSTRAQVSPVGAWEPAGGGDGPAPRWDHTLAADEADESLLLFGGRDGGGNAFADTWRFDADAGTWRLIDGVGPPARFGQAVAVDQEARVLYLFGGQVGSTFFDDTWRFDLETERWDQLGTTAGPASRYGHSAILDGAGNLVISHGFTFDGRFDDTWSLEPATGAWTDISPDPGATRPLPRCLHEAIWDANRDRMLLFGGCASGFGPCPLGDLWAFDPATRTWTDVTPAFGPAPRTNPALVLDATSGRALLFAGSTGAGYTFDAWSIDVADEFPVWTEQPQTGVFPEARSSLDAVVLGGRVYLFGGIGGAGPLADLWVADTVA